MTEEIERRFKAKQSNYIEEIVFDRVKRKFVIKRTYKNHETETVPLSTWHLTKEVETFVIICRQMESESFEQPTNMIFYRLNIKYSINELGEFWYLHSDITQNPDDTFERRFLIISLKNVNTGVGFSVPLPNSLYKGEYPFLVIEKSKAVKIEAGEIEKLLTSGQCLGIFDFKMENRIVR